MFACDDLESEMNFSGAPLNNRQSHEGARWTESNAAFKSIKGHHGSTECVLIFSNLHRVLMR